MYKFDHTTSELFTDEVNINFNVLGSMVKDVILCNINSTLIITIQCRNRIRVIETIKKIGIPYELNYGGSKGSVFDFNN